MTIKCGFSPANNFSTVSLSVLLPQIKRWSPKIHKSPIFDVGVLTSSGIASSSLGVSASSLNRKISRFSNPVFSSSSPKSSRSFSISVLSIDLSHVESSARRLSAIIYASFCASFKCEALTHGISESSSFKQAVTTA